MGPVRKFQIEGDYRAPSRTDDPKSVAQVGRDCRPDVLARNAPKGRAEFQPFSGLFGNERLPDMTRLRNHGLTFVNGFCNARMCSPSRAALVTGYFPAQHGVKYTLEEDMPASQYPQVERSRSLRRQVSVGASERGAANPACHVARGERREALRRWFPSTKPWGQERARDRGSVVG